MAPRAYWKGYLKLSLVSCPIALYPASSSSERVSFNRINKKTGHRLKQQNVDSVTGDPVEKDDIGRGYEFAKGQYIQVEDDELAKIQIESTHTIDIERFVPRQEVDDRYLAMPYYLAPFDKGLLATTLRYAYEVREQKDYFEDIPEIKLPAEMKELAMHIIDTKADHFDPKAFEDHYEKAIVELLRKKQAGRVVEPIRDAEPE